MESRVINFKAGFDVTFTSETPDKNTFICVVKAGSRTPIAHYHESFDETVKCLKGTITVFLGGKTFELTEGESLLIPKGVVHQIANKTPNTIEFYCEIIPGVFGYEYFHDIAIVTNVDGIPDMDEFMKIMKSYGLIPVIGLKQSLIFAVLRFIRLFKK
ncbi:cupin domain-containing protein [Emticicia sp. SJ17W-69]|uniref:cupin domain-containing protein n=1 Tax=Emticicia sp. SJ17W-69 TaxID=3421657 RepID=UPI003EBA71B9